MGPMGKAGGIGGWGLQFRGFGGRGSERALTRL